MASLYKKIFISSHQLSGRVQRLVGGLVLLFGIAAVVGANWSPTYLEFWNSTMGLGHLSRKEFVDEVLMSLFFFAAGLEIRHEFTHGSLRSKKQRRLPVICALGGMLLPITLMASWGLLTHYMPWTEASPIFHALPVPVATDTVFALALLSFFSTKIPAELRTFVLAFVVIDDIGGLLMLSGLEGKISPTIIAVICGFFLPEKIYGHKIRKKLLTHLTVMVSFVVLPIFALANAGVSFEGLTISALFSAPLFWAIISSQTIGKMVGVFYAAKLSVKKGWTVLPRGCSFRHMFVAASVAGIGFTLSLYLVEAALDETDPMSVIAKVAVVSATIIASSVAAFGAKGAPEIHASKRA